MENTSFYRPLRQTQPFSSKPFSRPFRPRFPFAEMRLHTPPCLLAARRRSLALGVQIYLFSRFLWGMDRTRKHPPRIIFSRYRHQTARVRAYRRNHDKCIRALCLTFLRFPPPSPPESKMPRLRNFSLNVFKITQNSNIIPAKNL